MKAFKLLLAFLGFCVPLSASAADYIYHQGNNQANFVTVEKTKPSRVGDAKLAHPHEFREEDLANMLRSLRYSRKAVFSDKVKSQFVFEEEYVKKYSPYLVQAFRQATPEETVFLSLVQKRPYVIIRNDRLTQIRMWVSGSELHLHFIKTEAQLQGDYQASTKGDQLINDAKGLRVELEPQTGQKFAADSVEELVLDLNADWAAIVAKLDAQEEAAKALAEAEKSRGKKAKDEKYKEDKAPRSAPEVSTPSYASPKDQKNAEERLTELKKLRDKGLIQESDYNKKKDEILKGL